MSRRATGGRLVVWLVLAAPAVAMAWALGNGTLAMDLLHPSGEMAVRLMILAMLPGPLADFFGAGRFLRRWLSIRRDLGISAFAYGLFHTVLYAVDMAALAPMIDELALPSIWTGWLSLVLLTVPASISCDAAMRRLGRRWKRLQRAGYAAFALALAHWLLLGWDWLPAVLHLLPLAAAWTLRAAARPRIRSRSTAS